MPVQQRCTVAGMTRLNPTTYWMVLEVGNMVEELGLRAGQFLHVACGEANLLRRPISVALAYPDEPEDTAALIFEVKGEGTRWLARRQVGDTVDVLGFRSADRVILEERYREACKEVYLCTDDGSAGRHGFVDAQVRDILEKDKNFTAILACGPRPMLKSVAAVAAEFGVPCQVSMEERMACGVGACLGCAIQMADGTMQHVCKDGPVFDAGEVDWNV